jgi:hypothetical protein
LKRPPQDGRSDLPTADCWRCARPVRPRNRSGSGTILDWHGNTCAVVALSGLLASIAAPRRERLAWPRGSSGRPLGMREWRQDRVSPVRTDGDQCGRSQIQRNHVMGRLEGEGAQLGTALFAVRLRTKAERTRNPSDLGNVRGVRDQERRSYRQLARTVHVLMISRGAPD